MKRKESYTFLLIKFSFKSLSFLFAPFLTEDAVLVLVVRCSKSSQTLVTDDVSLGALGQPHWPPHLLGADRALHTGPTHRALLVASVLYVIRQHRLDVLQTVVGLLEQLPPVQVSPRDHLVKNFYSDLNFDGFVIF